MKRNLLKKKAELKTNKQYTEEQFEREYRVELFFYNLPQLALVFICVFAIAYIFKRYIEAVTFLISFFSLRYKFKTTFHYENVFYCLITTIIMFTLSIIFSQPIGVSLFGSVLFAFLDTWILWFIQDRFECKLALKAKEIEFNNLVAELNASKDIYKMTEQELRQYAQSNGLSETICDTLVLKVIHNYRWVDIQKELNFTKEGIRYHKERIINKLKVNI